MSLRIFTLAVMLNAAALGDSWSAEPCARRCTSPTPHQCNRPNTATPPVVPTNTLPSAMVGVMNLLPVPN